MIKNFKQGYIYIIARGHLEIGLKITKNKTVEMEIINWPDQISFGVNFIWNWHQDHAGLNLDLNFLILEIHLRLRDTRHWDYENNCWEVYEESI